MTRPAQGTPGPPAADAAAAKAAVEAARERQSHVRHDLRAPLAVIYPLLSLLLDEGAGELTPKMREYLEVLERNVVRLEALLTGVADSGWTDCSAAPALPAEVAPADVAEEVVTLRRMGAQSSPPITVEAGPAPSPRAWADRDDVRQIITSLVRNAVTYTPAAGRITILIRSGDGGVVLVEVADTGPGMPAEELARAFEFGFRGELATQLRAPGLGAGLWICRELAQRNGGRLALASESGQGLRATLVLPAAPVGEAGDTVDQDDVDGGAA
jgi:signal transduction histidine kinase